MDFSNPNDPMIQAAVGSVLALITIIITLMETEDNERRGVPEEPSMIRDQWHNAHMYQILTAGPRNCVYYLKMSTSSFYRLANMLQCNGSLHDTKHVCVEEQLALFLYMLGHKSKNRVCGIEFIHSGETMSRCFRQVLAAISTISDQYMKQPVGEIPIEIRESYEWYPYFQDCIGLVDSTHVQATLPSSLAARFRGNRKQLTQKVLAAATPNKMFTYVLAGWEGCANDMTVLKDALSRPGPHGLKVITGKYYLVDAGYTTMPGFIAPYRGVRYHFNPKKVCNPTDPKELFNYMHSKLRAKIECAFATLKNRFCILEEKKFHDFSTQVDIVLACCLLHNYILDVDPNDELIVGDNGTNTISGEVCHEDLFDFKEFSQNSQRVQRNAKKAWEDKRDEIALRMWTDYVAGHGEMSDNFSSYPPSQIHEGNLV